MRLDGDIFAHIRTNSPVFLRIRLYSFVLVCVRVFACVRPHPKQIKWVTLDLHR